MDQSSGALDFQLKELLQLRATREFQRRLLAPLQELSQKVDRLTQLVESGAPANDQSEPELVSRKDAMFLLGLHRSTVLGWEGKHRLPRADAKVGRQRAYRRTEFDRVALDLPDLDDPRLLSRLRLYRLTGWSIATIQELEQSGRLPAASKVKEGAPWAYSLSEIEVRAPALGIDLKRKVG